MKNNTIVLLVIMTRQGLFMLSIVSLWIAMKTLEFWLFSIENWSNLVSWWWFAAVPVFAGLYGAVAYITRNVTYTSHTEGQPADDDIH